MLSDPPSGILSSGISGIVSSEYSTGYFQNPYKFNGKSQRSEDHDPSGQLDAETGLYYYGARYYDPRGSLWLGVDPMMEKYAGWTPYNYTVGNPVKFVDIDGRDIKLSFFTGANGENSAITFTNIINSGLGGQFEVYYTKTNDGKYLLNLKPTKGGGDFKKMSEESIALYTELYNMTTDHNTITEISIEYGSNVTIGNYIKNAIDIADVNQYDDMGKGPATKQGKLIHELVEQYGKAEDGIKKGSDLKYKSNHANGVSAENSVNGSTRDKESYTPRGNKYSTTYIDKKGKRTTYTYKTDDPIIKVEKKSE